MNPPKNKKIREEFESQFKALLEIFEKWGAENKCGFQSHLPTFKNKFFNLEWSGMHDTNWFEKYKANLETIWLRTQQSDFRDIEKQQIDSMFSDAFRDDQYPTCSIGSGNDIATLADLLDNVISMPRWLSRLCNKIVDQFAAEHIQKFDLREGIRNHVYLACRGFARDNGWPCSYDTTGTHDPYAADTRLEETDLIALLEEIKKKFIPKNILACILEDFKLAFDKLFPLGPTEWVPSTIKNVKFKLNIFLNN